MIDIHPHFSTLALLITSASFLFMIACNSEESDEQPDFGQTSPQDEYIDGELYIVTRLNEPVDINGEWDKEPWNSIEAFELNNFMGERPDHFPRVRGKVAYDDDAIYAIYEVEDQYVRCTRTEYQSAVFRDSAVEFFFTPGVDVSEGYFNLEMNCIGTALFHFQSEPWGDRDRLAEDHWNEVEVASTFTEVVEPEITEPTTWYLEYRIPFDILEEYHEITWPESGVEWRANFYKIGDETSHPHYITWSHVENDRPNFHMPEFFGTIRFE